MTRAGQRDDAIRRYARLEAWARERFPTMGEVQFRWSGQVMEPIDGLAFIGHNPLDAKNVFIATGDSGMGMTHGTIAGIPLTDLICNRENSWATLYDPARTELGSSTASLRLLTLAWVLLFARVEDETMQMLPRFAVKRRGNDVMLIDVVSAVTDVAQNGREVTAVTMQNPAERFDPISTAALRRHVRSSRWAVFIPCYPELPVVLVQGFGCHPRVLGPLSRWIGSALGRPTL